MSAKYFIVSTIKINKKKVVKEISAVPQNWIVDGQLFWPNKNLRCLQADPDSLPDKNNWSSCKCTILKSNIDSYSEALMWEEKYMEMDTEDEQA